MNKIVIVPGPGEQNLVDAYHVKYCFRRTIHVELQVINSCKCSFKLVCALGFSVVSDLQNGHGIQIYYILYSKTSPRVNTQLHFFHL